MKVFFVDQLSNIKKHIEVLKIERYEVIDDKHMNFLNKEISYLIKENRTKHAIIQSLIDHPKSYYYHKNNLFNNHKYN